MVGPKVLAGIGAAALALACIVAVPGTALAAKPIPKPAVLSLTVSPNTLPASGGTVRISVRATRATTCTVSVGPVARTYRCASGILIVSTKVAANTTSATKRLNLSVFANGKGGRSGTRRSVLTIATDVGPIGATLDVHDISDAGVLAVTVTSIIDPATPAVNDPGPDPGTRLIAVQETLDNIGTVTVSDDTYGDTSIIGSDGQGYQFVGNSVADCSSPGTFVLTGGESESTCVVYELPLGVNVATVHFTLSDGYVDTATWNV